MLRLTTIINSKFYQGVHIVPPTFKNTLMVSSLTNNNEICSPEVVNQFANEGGLEDLKNRLLSGSILAVQRNTAIEMDNPVSHSHDNADDKIIQASPNSDGDKKERYELEIDQIISQLPISLQDCIFVFKTPVERLMALFSSIAVTGALMPKVQINYANEMNYPALLLLVVFPPASGKGSLTHIRKLVVKINDHLLSDYKAANLKYLRDTDIYKQNLKTGNPSTKPEKPRMSMMLLPGNTSSAQIISSLADSCPDNMLVIFETEMDAYGVTATKGDFGVQNSTILRQAFHFEPISSFRKTHSELLMVETPKVVGVFSGTLSQVPRVVNPFDGTLTRFLTVMGISPVKWKDIKPCESCVNLDEHFEKLSDKWLEMWKFLVAKSVEVKFTDEQYDKINAFGTEKLALIHHFTGELASGIAKRHGNMIVRIAAILTMVRYFERSDTSLEILCEDQDFNTAFWMVLYSIECSLDLYKALPRQKGDNANVVSVKKHALLKGLPEHFIMADIKDLTKGLMLKDRTISRWLKEFVDSGYLDHVGHGEYKKTPMAALALSSLSNTEPE